MIESDTNMKISHSTTNWRVDSGSETRKDRISEEDIRWDMQAQTDGGWQTGRIYEQDGKHVAMPTPGQCLELIVGYMLDAISLKNQSPNSAILTPLY